MSQEERMPYHPTPTDAPYDPGRCRWIIDADGHQYPVVAVTRRRVVVDCFGARHTLCRRRLQRDGIDRAGGRTFAMSRYLLEEIA